MRQRSRKKQERGWVEWLCSDSACLPLFWARAVLRKWLNISSTDSDFSADESTESEPECEEITGWEQQLHYLKSQPQVEPSGNSTVHCKLRRQNSETLRVQYIRTKDLRIHVGTWNVGGRLPPDDLDIGSWLDVEEPADVYVLGLQEIVPLNAGNIFGAEDCRPVPKWEHLIRETLSRIKPSRPKYKCYSDPPSPSSLKPSEDVTAIEDDLFPEADIASDEEIRLLNEQSLSYPILSDQELISKKNGNYASNLSASIDIGSTQRACGEQSVLVSNAMMNSCTPEKIPVDYLRKLRKTLCSSDEVGLIQPEQSSLLSYRAEENSRQLISWKSFKSNYLFKLQHEKYNHPEEIALLSESRIDMDKYKKKCSFVRIIGKQMVGIYLSIWVRRSLRKHIQNIKVSAVGVGVMGYIGNKGAISVSMSIYQTSFCFICSHLASGEKDGDELRRNADVQEIQRRTQFGSVTGGLSKTIHDHERIIWLGDLNYRIGLSQEGTHELISKEDWATLVKKDQLKQQLKSGGAFYGWSEGVLNFPPTFKYEFDSDNYTGIDPKAGRRTPAWCDRVLSYGEGIKLVNYRRSEMYLSDHRPVTATFMVEVDVVCRRKLRRALTFTDPGTEDKDTADVNIDSNMAMLSPA